MQRDQVIAILRAHQTELQRLGVQSLELFGSVARNEAKPNSDVDLLAEFKHPLGLFRFAEIRLYLEKILQCGVDLGTRETLKEHLREPVLQEVMRVF